MLTYADVCYYCICGRIKSAHAKLQGDVSELEDEVLYEASSYEFCMRPKATSAV
jgi:hypothetical protein